MILMPSADHVACAIVAAARVTGEDPEHCIAKPIKPWRLRYSRCRYYALAVLALQFPSCPKVALGVFVGFQRKAGAVVLARGRPRRFREEMLNRAVVDYLALVKRHLTMAALVIEEPAAVKPAVVVVPSQSFAPGKRELYDMLARAVANTQGARLVSGDEP